MFKRYWQNQLCLFCRASVTFNLVNASGKGGFGHVVVHDPLGPLKSVCERANDTIQRECAVHGI